MCPEAIKVISKNERFKNYNLSDCDVVIPLKIVLWGPSKIGLNLNMEMLQDMFTLEATKKYTGITVSGKKLSQETNFFTNIMPTDKGIIGFVFEIGMFTGLEKLSKKGKYIFENLSGVIFIGDTNAKSKEKTIQSFTELKKFVKQERSFFKVEKTIPYLVQAISFNYKAKVSIDEFKSRLGLSRKEENPDDSLVVYHITETSRNNLVKCFEDMHLLSKINESKIKRKRVD